MRLKKHFYALICILFASICSLQAKVVTLTEAGTLSGMINDSELASLTELTVNGPINGSDIKIIRAMGGTLKTLDLKNANIVKGGDSYYLTNYFTQDNVIGDYMFYAMTALEKIAMPKDVWAIGSWNSDNPWNAEKTKIGGYPNNYDSYYNNNDQFGCASFYQCVNLKEIEFPSTLVYIGSKAFGNCVKLTSITIPEGVELMGNSVFMNCAELISASLPSTLGNPNKMDIEDWQIRDYAGYNNINGAQDRDYDTSSAEYYAHRGCLATFYNCPKLKNVTLAEGIKLLMNRMFLNCTALTSITLPSTVTRVNSAFMGCSGLTKITFPETTVEIGSLQGCTGLTTLSIPTNVNVNDFYCTDCSALTSVSFKGNVGTRISSSAFSGCAALASINIPTAVNSIGTSSFDGCAALASLTMPETLASIGEYAFRNSGLTSLTLYRNLTIIGKNAFDGCTELTSINFPANVTEIKEYTFNNCAKLKDIVLPNGLIYIKDYAFNGCSSLGKVTIPGGVQNISPGAFKNSGLTEVILKEGVMSLSNNSFDGCLLLKKVTFPTTMKTIGGFSNTGIKEIAFAANAAPEAISSFAFLNCDSLSTITLPNSIKEIGRGAFYDCDTLQSITLSTSIKAIAEQTFHHCNSLKSIKIPEGVTEIGYDAFYQCYIEEINFPAALTTIGARSLRYCRIDTLRLPATVTEIGQNAFYYAKFDCVEIPSTITKINSGAFYEAEIRGSLNITPNAALAWGDGGYTPFRCYGNEYITNEDGTSYNRYYHLPDVYWNSAAEFPRDKFGQIDNLYLPANGAVSSNNDIGYIFYNGLTKRIDIAYTNENRKYSFSVNKEMKTQMINYRKHFSTNSGYGEAAGWKTIVLPFDVKEISYERDGYNEKDTVALAPFGSKALETAGTLPFWLYELGTDGKYKAATEIKAHKAYLICMPNNEKYPSENNISGYVNFTTSDATNGVTLKPTAGALKRSKGTKFDFVPTYEGVMQHDTVYVLNENNYYNTDEKNYPAGSVFIKNYSEHYSNPAVYPFEAYLVTNEGKTSVASAPMLYSIGGGDGTITGIEDIPFATPEKATKAYSRNGVLYINTNADRTINIYDVTGRTVRIIEAREGMNEVHGLDSGIYLLEGQKVVIGR